MRLHNSLLFHKISKGANSFLFAFWLHRDNRWTLHFLIAAWGVFCCINKLPEWLEKGYPGPFLYCVLLSLSSYFQINTYSPQIVILHLALALLLSIHSARYSNCQAMSPGFLNPCNGISLFWFTPDPNYF